MARPTHAQRLLERFIASDVTSAQRQSKTDRQLLLESVTSHLARLLNTRQGTVAIDPEYGIPDFSSLPGSFAPPESKRIAESIAQLVMRYEPRLSNVAVEFLGAGAGQLQMGFRLSGVIHHGNERIDLHLATGLRADGSFAVPEHGF